MYQRLFIITILGFSSGLPLALISSTLQAWFSDTGQSLVLVGAISLVGMPYLYRFFWAPLLDRYALFGIGRRKGWMFAMQLMLFCGFHVMAWMHPNTAPREMIALAFILACCSATQDVAIEAQRTEYLQPSEYGLGASLAVFAYRLAMLVSGGLALIVADTYGWKLSYQMMAMFMIPGILASLMSQEPAVQHHPPVSIRAQFVLPFIALWQKKGIVSILLFILLFKAGEAFTSTTSGIVMPFLIQGLGFSLATIGWVNKIVAVAAVIVGGIFAGLLMLRWSIFRCLMVFGLLQALTNVCFVFLAKQGHDITYLLLAVISDNLATGMGTTALVAFLMHIVDKKYTASQLSVLVAFSTIPRIFSGPVGAYIQEKISWVGLYQLSVLIALLYIPFLWNINRQNRFSMSKTKALECL